MIFERAAWLIFFDKILSTHLVHPHSRGINHHGHMGERSCRTGGCAAGHTGGNFGIFGSGRGTCERGHCPSSHAFRRSLVNPMFSGTRARNMYESRLPLGAHRIHPSRLGHIAPADRILRDGLGRVSHGGSCSLPGNYGYPSNYIMPPDISSGHPFPQLIRTIGADPNTIPILPSLAQVAANENCLLSNNGALKEKMLSSNDDTVSQRLRESTTSMHDTNVALALKAIEARKRLLDSMQEKENTAADLVLKKAAAMGAQLDSALLRAKACRVLDSAPLHEIDRMMPGKDKTFREAAALLSAEADHHDLHARNADLYSLEALNSKSGQASPTAGLELQRAGNLMEKSISQRDAVNLELERKTREAENKAANLGSMDPRDALELRNLRDESRRKRLKRLIEGARIQDTLNGVVPSYPDLPEDVKLGAYPASVQPIIGGVLRPQLIPGTPDWEKGVAAAGIAPAPVLAENLTSQALVDQINKIDNENAAYLNLSVPERAELEEASNGHNGINHIENIAAAVALAALRLRRGATAAPPIQAALAKDRDELQRRLKLTTEAVMLAGQLAARRNAIRRENAIIADRERRVALGQRLAEEAILGGIKKGNDAIRAEALGAGYNAAFKVLEKLEKRPGFGNSPIDVKLGITDDDDEIPVHNGSIKLPLKTFEPPIAHNQAEKDAIDKQRQITDNIRGKIVNNKPLDTPLNVLSTKDGDLYLSENANAVKIASGIVFYSKHAKGNMENAGLDTKKLQEVVNTGERGDIGIGIAYFRAKIQDMVLFLPTPLNRSPPQTLSGHDGVLDISQASGIDINEGTVMLEKWSNYSKLVHPTVNAPVIMVRTGVHKKDVDISGCVEGRLKDLAALKDSLVRTLADADGKLYFQITPKFGVKEKIPVEDVQKNLRNITALCSTSKGQAGLGTAQDNLEPLVTQKSLEEADENVADRRRKTKPRKEKLLKYDEKDYAEKIIKSQSDTLLETGTMSKENAFNKKPDEKADIMNAITSLGDAMHALKSKGRDSLRDSEGSNGRGSIREDFAGIMRRHNLNDKSNLSNVVKADRISRASSLAQSLGVETGEFINMVKNVPEAVIKEFSKCKRTGKLLHDEIEQIDKSIESIAGSRADKFRKLISSGVDMYTPDSNISDEQRASFDADQAQHSVKLKQRASGRSCDKCNCQNYEEDEPRCKCIAIRQKCSEPSGCPLDQDILDSALESSIGGTSTEKYTNQRIQSVMEDHLPLISAGTTIIGGNNSSVGSSVISRQSSHPANPVAVINAAGYPSYISSGMQSAGSSTSGRKVAMRNGPGDSYLKGNVSANHGIQQKPGVLKFESSAAASVGTQQKGSKHVYTIPVNKSTLKAVGNRKQHIHLRFLGKKGVGGQRKAVLTIC